MKLFSTLIFVLLLIFMSSNNAMQSLFKQQLHTHKHTQEFRGTSSENKPSKRYVPAVEKPVKTKKLKKD